MPGSVASDLFLPEHAHNRLRNTLAHAFLGSWFAVAEWGAPSGTPSSHGAKVPVPSTALAVAC